MAKKILVPLDQSPASAAVMAVAAALARDSGGTLRLLHVKPVPENVVNEAGRVVVYADQEITRLEAEGMDYLQTVETQFGAKAAERVVRFGSPVEEILQEAEAFGADLIAMTTTGRSAVGRVLLGSVAEQILRKAEAPVMLVRAGRHPA